MEKKWKTGRQTKLGWQKQGRERRKERKEKTNDRRRKNDSEISGRKGE